MLTRLIVHAQSQQGDVPGWVLVTLMTAGIVGALWVLAQPMLVDLFSDAVSNVRRPPNQ